MIYCFYSYKGGVGRSMALANVAECLYRRGARVLMIDWDLEAPGLENFFFDEGGLRTVRSQLGVIDMLLHYKRQYSVAASTPRPKDQETGQRDTSAQVGIFDTVQPYLLPLQSLVFPIHPPQAAEDKKSRGLWLLPSGWRATGGRTNIPNRREEGSQDDRFSKYAESVQSFDWADFYAHFEGEAFFNWFRSQLSVTSSPTLPDSAPRDAMGFDAVLIDSRTGVTEMGGVCTRQLADVIVSFCAPNDQNLYGIAAMSESFLREDLRHIRGGRLPEVLVVPARVDLAGETTEQNIFHSLFDEQLKPPPTFQRLGLKMWDTLIPYVVKYAYRESMAIGAPDSNPIMEKAYSELTTRLVLFAGPESNLQKYFASDLLQLRRSSGLGALEPALSPTEDLMVKISSVFASLTIQEQTMAKRVVTRLVTPTGVRLSTALDDFEPAERDIAQRLADAGLLTIKTSHKSGETTIELAHDILIQQWTALQQWLAEDREFLIWRQQVRSALAAWEQTGRDRDALLPQTLASQAASWMSRRPDDLNTKERKFISASVERHQRFAGGRLFQRFASSPFFVTGSLLYIAALGTVIANFSGIKGTSAAAILWGTVGGTIMGLVRRVGIQTTGSTDSPSPLSQLKTALMNAVAGGVLVVPYQVLMKTQVPALLAFNLGALGSLVLSVATTTLSRIEPSSKYTKGA